MLFDSHEISTGANHIRLYAEMLVQFDNAQDENIALGTPKGWDELVLQCVNIERYDIYYICTHTLPKERVNRITDYKKIWGLVGLPQGIFTDEYINKIGKVYFGIAKADSEDALGSGISAMILLVKKGNDFSCEDVFKLFKEHQYVFGDENDGDDLVLMQVSELYRNSILLKYECIRNVSLDVYGKNVEHLFSNVDLGHYNKCEDEVVWRRPCS